MAKWKYRSLEWIHKVREENYEKNKRIALKDIIKNSVTNAKRKERYYVN